jgi:Cu(I)/Ag(I) efflux system membrane fusion protein
MSVARLDRVWVLAEVFERQSAWVSPGQSATVELDYLPGRVLRGTVDYVYPELDPKTRTLRVRLRFDNESETLRPNMFARVVIDGTPVNNIVHVPREAVIRGGSSSRVVVDLGDGKFQSRKIRIGIESGDRVAIRSGLKAGERVVTSAQFLIDSESNIDAALERLESAR